jgi:hypothetical protein
MTSSRVLTYGDPQASISNKAVVFPFRADDLRPQYQKRLKAVSKTQYTS